MRIISLKCPVCGEVFTINVEETNSCLRKHHKENHPGSLKLIQEKVMEVGKLKDKIDRIIEDVKRITGYKISH